MKKLGLLLLCLSLMLMACEDVSDEFVQDIYESDGEEAEFEDEANFENDLIDDEATDTAVTMPGTFQDANCPFRTPLGSDIECGYLSVPEDRSSASSPTIRLAVALVPAPNGSKAPPVLYLAGGPGGSALDDYAADPESWEYDFLQNRDLILLDQRGTGYSEPSLDCPEFAEVAEQENPDALCYDRLSEDGINLDAYNTAENAADVADLRLALGLAEWDLLGISYGTRLALEVMRSHPEGVRAVILDSPFPPNADTPVEEIFSLTDALTELYADCERDKYCGEEYPDLEAVFLETIRRLNEDEGEVFGDDLVFALSEAFSDTELIPLLPYVIYEVADGNFAALDEISADDGFARSRYQDDEDRSDSEGMYNSVICHDEFAVGDYERVETAVVGKIPAELEGALLQSTFDQVQLCEYWNPMTTVDNTAVASNIPTLILVGQYDVATPPRWGTLTAATLPNSYLFQIPGAGHSLLSSVECTVSIANDFLESPSRSPKVDCLEEIEWPYFE